MKKPSKSLGIFTRFFKFLFKPSVSAIENQLKNDPELRRLAKEIRDKNEEIRDYIDDNFAGYGGYSKSDSED